MARARSPAGGRRQIPRLSRSTRRGCSGPARLGVVGPVRGFGYGQGTFVTRATRRQSTGGRRLRSSRRRSLISPRAPSSLSNGSIPKLFTAWPATNRDTARGRSNNVQRRLLRFRVCVEQAASSHTTWSALSPAMSAPVGEVGAERVRRARPAPVNLRRPRLDGARASSRRPHRRTCGGLVVHRPGESGETRVSGGAAAMLGESATASVMAATASRAGPRRPTGATGCSGE